MAKRPVQAHEEFVFELGAPCWAYSFSLQHVRGREEPYAERQCLECRATCLYPDRFKSREAEVRLYGERYLIKAADLRPAEPPKGVGSITATKAKFELWADLPADACWQIGAAIAAGSIRYLLANAPVYAPKHSFINSLSFKGPDFDAAGYIG